MIVRTVLGDISPDELGFCLSHEHLIGEPPAELVEPDLQLNSEADAIKELNHFAAAGGSAVVEMSTPDYKRNIAALRRISQASDVHIVAATGFNQARFADHHSAKLSEDELVNWMVIEITAGVAEPPRFMSENPGLTGSKAGLLKGASSLNGPSTDEKKVLRAVARAHQATGAPVSTHTEKATWALEQAQYLIEHGVTPEKLLIGHLDFNPDAHALAEIASLGVYLGLDQFSKAKYLADEKRVDLVVDLLDRGCQRLLLSGDLARQSYWRVNGGAGFPHHPETVREMLRANGLAEMQLEQLYITNPRNLLSFTP